MGRSLTKDGPFSVKLLHREMTLNYVGYPHQFTWKANTGKQRGNDLGNKTSQTGDTRGLECIERMATQSARNHLIKLGGKNFMEEGFLGLVASEQLHYQAFRVSFQTHSQCPTCGDCKSSLFFFCCCPLSYFCIYKKLGFC